MKEDLDDHYKDSTTSTSTSDVQIDRGTWTELPVQTIDNSDLETAGDTLESYVASASAQETSLEQARALADSNSIVQLRFGKKRDEVSGALYLQHSMGKPAGDDCDPERYVQIMGTGGNDCYLSSWLFEKCGETTSADSAYPGAFMYNIRAVDATGTPLNKYLKCAASNLPSSKICEAVPLNLGQNCHESDWQSFAIVQPE